MAGDGRGGQLGKAERREGDKIGFLITEDFWKFVLPRGEEKGGSGGKRREKEREGGGKGRKIKEERGRREGELSGLTCE